MPIRLVPREGPPLGGDAAWDDPRPRVLGRAAACDVVISGSGVSKRHCSIERRDEAWWVADLGSSNGTYVNRRRVAGPTRLGDGDELLLGVYCVKVAIESPPAVPRSGEFRIRDENGERRLAVARLVLGRRADCHVVVPDSGVSRHHAAIVQEAEGFVLRDLDSRNGTFVGDDRLVSHRLQGGERIALAQPAGDPDRTLLLATLEGACLRLEVLLPERSTVGFGGTAVLADDARELRTAMRVAAAGAPPPPSAVRRAKPTEVAPVSAAAGRVPVIPDSTSLSRVIPMLTRGKAKYRGAKWVPTSDLLPNPARRAINALCFLLAFGAGASLLAWQRAQHLSPGPIASVHLGVRFVNAAGSGEPCRPCHAGAGAVDNGRCLACHPHSQIPAPHDAASLTVLGHPTLVCADCHLEHLGDRVPERMRKKGGLAMPADVPHALPALPVDRLACLGCHPAAHERTAVFRDTPGSAFLNDYYSSTWIHTMHASRPACAGCHATAQAQSSGKVTTACYVCHGGSISAIEDGQCQTCHYLHRQGPLLLKREAKRG